MPAHRPQESGVSESQHTAVGGDLRVSATIGRGGDAHDRCVEACATHRAEIGRMAEGEDSTVRTRPSSSPSTGGRRHAEHLGAVQIHPRGRAVEAGVAGGEHRPVGRGRAVHRGRRGVEEIATTGEADGVPLNRPPPRRRRRSTPRRRTARPVGPLPAAQAAAVRPSFSARAGSMKPAPAGPAVRAKTALAAAGDGAASGFSRAAIVRSPRSLRRHPADRDGRGRVLAEHRHQAGHQGHQEDLAQDGLHHHHGPSFFDSGDRSPNPTVVMTIKLK